MESQTEAENLGKAIQALEDQRQILGDAVVEAALAPLREKLASLQARPLGEQRKLVSVLFADLVGFTALASRMDAEDVREIINDYFQRWSACIKRQEGVVEKFIGDAVLAVFGLRTAHEDDPERAIRAALEMRKELQQLNDRLEPERGLRLSMRVGIHTGPVVVSLLGERGGEEFVVVGDAVNLASRLQAAAPGDGILITHDTYRHVAGLFETSPFGPLQLKGISRPIQAYRIKAAKPRSYRLGIRGVEGVETRMVGRQGELKRLQDMFHQVVRDHERYAVTVVGEAGLGKSRLLYEFEHWVELLPEKVFYFRGRAHHASQNVPYSLVRDVFAFRCQIQDSDPPPVVREKIEATVGQALGEDGAGQMKALWIARLLGFEIGESEGFHGVEGDAKSLHDRALVYLGDYLRALGAVGPAIILLEDLHWADDSSLDLIYHLESSLARQPFLIVCTARPSLFERRPHWGEGLPFHTRLDLSRLPKRESRALVKEILKKVHPLPAALQSLVVNTAEGNPFYIEELIKMLIEDRVIVNGEGRWHVEEERLGDLRVPPTLIGVLQARFDSLAPEQRTALQRGAVIGRVFWDRAVDSLGAYGPAQSASSRPDDIDEIFEELRRREMIFRREKSTFEDTIEYLFKHALLRDVTYSNLLKSQRRVYHALAARWLEEVTARTQRSGEFSMLIAEHYEQAGEFAQSAEWYLRAGRTAAARFANAEAVRALTRALELAPESDPNWEFAVLLEREKVYELLGERDEQLPDLAALQDAAEKTGDPSHRATVALRRAQYAYQTADYAAALEYAQRAEELAGRSQNLELAARSSLLQAAIVMRQGEFELSEGHAQRALTLASGGRIPAIEAEGYRQLGVIAYYLGKPHLARDHFAQALKLFEQAGDRQGEGSALNNLGGAAFNIGEYDEAGMYYARSLQVCREIGDRMGEGRALNNLGIISVSQGKYAQAEEYYLQALQISREVGYRSFEMSALDNLGNVASYRYDYSLAQKYQLESLRGAREIGDRVTETITLINLGRSYLSVGDYERASNYLQESLDLNRQFNDRQGSCHSLNTISLYKEMVGDIKSSQVYAEEALALAEEFDLRSEQAWGLHSSGRVLYQMERFTEAAEHFRQAQEIRQELGEFKEANESLACLARACLGQGDLEQAAGSVDAILAHLTEQGVEGFEAPVEIFLSCYRVLQAAQDPRAADILKKGYDLLQQIASKIDDEAMRQSFFEQVPDNRALIKAWMEANEHE